MNAQRLDHATQHNKPTFNREHLRKRDSYMTRLRLADRTPLHPLHQVAKKNRPLSLLDCEVFPRSTGSPTGHDQSSQPDADPDQLAETPQEREGDASHVTVAEGFGQQQIADVLRAEAAKEDGRTRSIKSPQTDAVAVRAPIPTARKKSLSS